MSSSRFCSNCAFSGTVLIFYGLTLFSTRGPGSRPSLSMNDVMLLAGAALWILAFALGASSILRMSRSR